MTISNPFRKMLAGAAEEMKEYELWMDDEAEWLNKEYNRVFGELPGGIGLSRGCPMTLVHATQARIVRHYIEEMKKVLK